MPLRPSRQKGIKPSIQEIARRQAMLLLERARTQKRTYIGVGKPKKTLKNPKKK